MLEIVIDVNEQTVAAAAAVSSLLAVSLLAVSLLAVSSLVVA